jgi:hypothetical protein
LKKEKPIIGCTKKVLEKAQRRCNEKQFEDRFE